MPALVMTSHFTALGKGGKLSVSVLPPFIRNNRTSSYKLRSSFRLGHDGQTAMACSVDGPNAEYHIILGNLQSCTCARWHRLDIPPSRTAGRAPDNVVCCSASRWLPG